jgi:multicomponent Na+:H+ antiporter subunit B
VSRGGRRGLLALPALLVLAGLFGRAAADLPAPQAAPGHVAQVSTAVAVHERRVSNAVSAVTFDLRGFDTLGEELILFTAALGTTVLLRAHRGERRERSPVVPGPVRVLGAWLVGPMVLLGGYLVVHGQLTPGGGFQGGVVLAAALLMVYAAAQMLAVRRLRPMTLVEVTEAVGAGAYAVVAIGGLVFGTAAMANVLPLGTFGDLWSGGTIPILNAGVALEVTGALTLIVSELADQALLGGAES